MTRRRVPFQSVRPTSMLQEIGLWLGCRVLRVTVLPWLALSQRL